MRLRLPLAAVMGWLLLLALCGGVPAAARAAEDVSGASDPLGIKRYPRSWIVSFDNDTELAPREFVLSRVDKTRRDVRVEREVRPMARRQWATYQAPPGASAAAVFDHYLEVLGGRELFSCSGRDCGRSNHWANYIFEQAILYGPDGNQFYFAGELDDVLVAVYVIERGNKRVYARLEVLTPENSVAFTASDVVLERLARVGAGVVDGVSPEPDGSISATGAERLAALAEPLRMFSGRTVYVVCHLYGQADTEDLLQRSAACAARAADLLTAGDASGEGPSFVPFAAGPLLPRLESDGLSIDTSRIELVMPGGRVRPRSR